MDGWRIDPTRLRALREQAGLTAVAAARAVGMHVQSYRKLEAVDHHAPGLAPTAMAEPAAERAAAITALLAEHRARPVQLADFATRVESQRAAATSYRAALDLLGPDIVAAIRARLGPPKPLSPEQIATLVPIFLRGEPQRADPAA